MQLDTNIIELLLGAKVCYLPTNEIGVIVDFKRGDRSQYIYVHYFNSDTPEHNKTYVFPSIFLGTDKKMQLVNGAPELHSYFKEERKNVCQRCGKYNIDIATRGEHHFCEECNKEIKECEACHKLIVNAKRGIDGKLYCKSCHKKRFPFVTRDLSTPTWRTPTLYVQTILPSPCICQHTLYNVKAKVKVQNGDKTSFAYINLHYCKNCNKYYILKKSLEQYEARYGNIFIRRRYTPGGSGGQSQHSYEPDSILSEWGYKADGSLSSSQRQGILSFMMQDGIEDKSDIASLLSYFIETRSKRCPYAAELWKEDLEYVNEYRLDEQPEVDFTPPSDD